MLADGRLSLQADCNRGGGAYTVSGVQITLQPGPMTLAACAPGSQDTLFMRDLRRVVTFVRDGANREVSLRLDPAAVIRLDRQTVALGRLPVGTPILAHYETRNGRQIVPTA